MSFQGAVAPLAPQTVSELSEKAREDLARMRAGIVELEGTASRLRAENEQIVDECDDLRAEVKELRTRVDDLENELAIAESQIEELSEHTNALAKAHTALVRGDASDARRRIGVVLDHLDSAWSTRA